VGWWPLPSPALITGTGLTSAAIFAEPSILCLITIPSTYEEITLIESSRDSPLIAEENSAAFSVPMTRPPSFSIADSKLRRVLVLGS